jgi:AcrR family transcriptional regulator
MNSVKMKISKEKKAENRRSIISTAVELMGDKGFKAATMRQIAKAAGLGEATIYNYFPTKEAILYAYYEDHMLACIDQLKAVPEFETFTLQEQLQTFFDTSLSLYLSDRAFVEETFRLALLGASRDWPHIRPIRAAFLSAVQDMLVAAEEVGEIPAQVFQELLGQLFMDAYIGVVLYWLGDRSEGFENTSVLLDRGLDLTCAMLKAGVANKLFDMAVFLFKTHIVDRMEMWMTPLKTAAKTKRRFMEAVDE